MSDENKPWVLIIGGHDPTGGAGIQADIEATLSFGCRPATVVSCLTVQDSKNVSSVHPIDVTQTLASLDSLLNDFGPPAAIKTGLIGDPDLALALGERLAKIDAPLVVDPVLAAGGGRDLSDTDLVDAMRKGLVNRATLCTPNLKELQRLAPAASEIEEQTKALLSTGCFKLLVTAADEGQDPIENRLYSKHAETTVYRWPRIKGPSEGQFHGTGCTLASAAAALLGRGEPVEDAVRQAQAYVAESLTRAGAPGKGQALPNRLFWTTEG